MRACDSDTELATLETCTLAVIHGYVCKYLLLNADKSEVVKFQTDNQLRSAADVESVSVAGELLPVASEIKSLMCYPGPATNVRRLRQRRG